MHLHNDSAKFMQKVYGFTDAMGAAVTATSTAATLALLIPHLPPIRTLLPPLITLLCALLLLMLSPLGALHAGRRAKGLWDSRAIKGATL
jgi:hypothetical protein